MLNKQVTIKDLARKLRISISTVSRALRGVQDINSETRKQVLELARELNYEPNYIATSLVNKQTKLIGVIMPVISSQYFVNALSGMMEVADANGYHIMSCLSDESIERETAYLKKLVSIRIDGLLISVSKDTTNVDEFINVQRKGIHVIFFDRVLENIEATKVTVNQYEGAFLAVEHLIKKGYKRIAHIGGPRHLSIAADRLQGYLDALAKYNISKREDYILYCENFESEALDKIKNLFSLKQKPNAIFAINDSSAIICMKYLQELGYKIPKDVAIAGYNNDPVSEVVSPSLTTVMQPSYEVGKLAAQLLIDEIENKSNTYEKRILKSELIIRSST